MLDFVSRSGRSGSYAWGKSDVKVVWMEGDRRRMTTQLPEDSLKKETYPYRSTYVCTVKRVGSGDV